MGEIRSTLDIIMEKTKGLTMTDEEKRDLKHKEITRKIRALVQKHLDGIIDLERFKAETTAAGEGQEDMLQGIMRKELLSRIKPGKDNEALLRLLGHVTLEDIPRVRQILDDFKRRLKKEKEGREIILRRDFENRGISGSSVAPNLLKDDKWDHIEANINEEFQKTLVV